MWKTLYKVILVFLKDQIGFTFIAGFILVCFFHHALSLPLLQDEGTIVGFPGAKDTSEDLLIAECDILVPAANELQITAKNAPHIKAKVKKILGQKFLYFYSAVSLSFINSLKQISAWEYKQCTCCYTLFYKYDV